MVHFYHEACSVVDLVLYPTPPYAEQTSVPLGIVMLILAPLTVFSFR